MFASMLLQTEIVKKPKTKEVVSPAAEIINTLSSSAGKHASFAQAAQAQAVAVVAVVAAVAAVAALGPARMNGAPAILQDVIRSTKIIVQNPVECANRKLQEKLQEDTIIAHYIDDFTERRTGIFYIVLRFELNICALFERLKYRSNLDAIYYYGSSFALLSFKYVNGDCFKYIPVF